MAKKKETVLIQRTVTPKAIKADKCKSSPIIAKKIPVRRGKAR